jgi:hypothetical protein
MLATPQLLHQLSKLLCQVALGTQYILFVDLAGVVAFAEVLDEGRRVAQALNGGVHVTCVAKIAEPSCTRFSIFQRRLGLFFIALGLRKRLPLSSYITTTFTFIMLHPFYT